MATNKDILQRLESIEDKLPNGELEEMHGMIKEIKEILLEAISSGGSSLRDFRNASGDLGYFQHSFDVYGREDQDCYNTECDSKIKRITQAGRSSFYCSNCQR